MKALVTGAGGFLGGAIARTLRARGDEVRGFSRGEYPALSALGVEHVRGDVGDAQAVHRAVEGVDVVFHVAAKVSAAGEYAEFHATNVVGAQNVLDACRQAGVRALVYTSTPSVASCDRRYSKLRSRKLRPSRSPAARTASKAAAISATSAAENTPRTTAKPSRRNDAR